MQIYYFTGTGNSLKAALDIAGALGGEAASMSKTGLGATCLDDAVGFVFPVYSQGLPNMVHRFIESISLKAGAYIFAVATCGMSSGNSFAEINSALAKQGARLSYASKLKTVANYIVGYNPSLRNLEIKLAKADTDLARIISDIKERKESKAIRPSIVLSAMHNRQALGFAEKDKGYTVSEECNSCAVCSSVCPAGNIKMVDGLPEFGHKCEQCMACIHWCPLKAINYQGKTESRNRYTHPAIKASQLP
ncbi:MAG: 4Fe-4S dicluster domain-containing protein [Eubacteriaceae bacterium]|jgi:ferredoxin/flavodoxin|nr:4Fe-4S dicluster domain-containing protein [Eubacteriaceae bacterium]